MQNQEDVVAMLDTAGLEYAIVDAENPENNQVIPVAGLNSRTDTASGESREEAFERRFQRVAHNVRVKLAEAINRRREAENKRAARGRLAKRRRARDLAKVSRKGNR